MDRRNEELKILKKAYKREKRSAVSFWKLLSILSAVLCLALAPLNLAAFLPGTVAMVDNGIALASKSLPGVGSLLNELTARGNILVILLGVCLLILAVAVFMWIAGSRKLKKTDAFLSYRTLRETLKAEKKEM